MVKFLFLITVMVLSVSGYSQHWKKYHNERFGYSLLYPGTLLSSGAPTDGTGGEFHTPNKEFSVAVEGGSYSKGKGDSFDSRWKKELEVYGGTITYKKRARGWFVVSGVTKGGLEYYRKFFSRGGDWVSLTIQYAHSKNAEYDPWVEKIEGSLKVFIEPKPDQLDTAQ